jgi:uncharacterized membrane protein
MHKSFLKDLPELIKNGIISKETAENIREYYEGKAQSAPNRLLIIFGILGALLVGAGLILIIAHNWEDMSWGTQTFIAFTPLVVGQGLCLYSLIKQWDSIVWRESSSTFLFFAIALCISLVGQIYNIPGTTSSFLMSWMLLSFPLMYIMRSSMASMLYLLGISYYGWLTGYWDWFNTGSANFWYWGLLALFLPYYYMLMKREPTNNFLTFQHWLLAGSVILMLGRLSGAGWVLNFISYTSLFALLYQIGKSPMIRGTNGYMILGAIGSLVMLFIGSFYDFWNEMFRDLSYFEWTTNAIMIAAGLTIGSIALIIWRWQEDEEFSFDPFNYIFIAFIPIFFLGIYHPVVATALANLILLAIGIATIAEGARTHHLGVLNFGLLIISVLIICRYFDIQISFVIRGVLFVLIGIGFFVANYRMMQLRKKQ